jgi:hypothetical protein
MHKMPGEFNVADILSKHYGHTQVWSMLRKLLFWKGDTKDNNKMMVLRANGECEVDKIAL